MSPKQPDPTTAPPAQIEAPSPPRYYRSDGRHGSAFTTPRDFDLDSPPTGMLAIATFLRANPEVHDIAWSADDGLTVVVKRVDP